jgi:hypothetical protein
MRLRLEKERRGLLLRCWSSDYRQGEIAYAVIGLRGLRADIEFPSDWHEHRRAWVRLGFGVLLVAFSFPWRKTVPDDYQCSGPTYGFYFFDDSLVLQYGKSHGRRGDPQKHIRMPWAWIHREHKILSEKEVHPYRYTLASGEVQERTATINVESRLWTRYWLPHRLYKRTIDIEFNVEVGERTGSWKGGTTGCSYNMLPNETPVECLRRMEIERSFT